MSEDDEKKTNADGAAPPNDGEQAPSDPAIGKDKPSRSTRASAKPRSSSVPTPLDTFATVEAAWGYPAFARDFPRHPELDELVAAFARGDYLTVRERAPKLASSTADAKIKRAAETLRERIEPDRSSKVLFLLAGLLLAFLTGWWVTHDGPAEERSHLAPAASSSTHTH